MPGQAQRGVGGVATTHSQPGVLPPGITQNPLYRERVGLRAGMEGRENLAPTSISLLTLYYTTLNLRTLNNPLY
jgi:hypothetical protein